MPIRKLLEGPKGGKFSAGRLITIKAKQHTGEWDESLITWCG